LSIVTGTMKIACEIVGAVLLVHPVVHAQQCPIEVKLLLSPSTTQVVAASLGFAKGKASRVYFYDTPALDLARQGVSIRVRQGANDDLTVKVRTPVGDREVADSPLIGRFPCETDRTPAAVMTSYAVARAYSATNIPAGNEIFALLSDSQKRLLEATRARVDWTRIVRIVEISAMTWHTSAKAPSGKLVLEQWEWPAGRILELSGKTAPSTGELRFAQLEGLVKTNGLSLSQVQDTKTSVVLSTLDTRASEPLH
jgi:hypothetical protein